MSSTWGQALPRAGEEMDILMQCDGRFSNPSLGSWMHVWLLTREGGPIFSHSTSNQGKEAFLPHCKAEGTLPL